MPDQDGYPEDEELDRIVTWKIERQADIDALWAFCKDLWFYPERFAPMLPLEGDEEDFWTADADWQLSTGGWSGNEDVIGALMRNRLFWAVCWRCTRTGGHYGFKIGNVIHEPPPVHPEPAGTPPAGPGRHQAPGEGHQGV